MNGQMLFKNFKVYRRAHGFVRDAWTSNYIWSARDFLLHAVKHTDDIIFTKELSFKDCSTSNWLPVKASLYVNLSMMKSIWREVDKRFVNNNLGIEVADIANCWPHCPENITHPGS